MKPILQNLVEMTGHRDHLRLEVSVLSTLQALSSIVQVRALEVFSKDDALYVRPRTWMDNGQWRSAETENASDPASQPIDQIPALNTCIQERSP
ncbi:MAG TPA: GGDEF domain-containing protein, partial [Comamonadaceae bacterium]|nr:GGDEF domain-containing protein [Comamonadaceae bacterium]